MKVDLNMNKKLLQDTIDFVTRSVCDSLSCKGPTMRPTVNTCARCALLARLLKSAKVYKPRASRTNQHLNILKEN